MLVIVGSLAPRVVAQVTINEIQADNETTLADEEGDFEDWLELYNSGPVPLDIGGYGLSDDPADPLAWTFPAGTIIGPGAFLLVWTDDDDEDGPLHTNFKIDKDGEVIVLSAPGGTLLDTVGPVAIGPDESLGRVADGSGDWFLLGPTPGVANVGPGTPPAPAPPVFSVAGGFQPSGVQLDLSHWDPAVAIRYTLDGSEPDLASPLYSGPISLASRAGEANRLSLIWTGDPRWRSPAGEVYKVPVVRARAFRAGASDSAVATHTYLIGSDASRYPGASVVSLVSDEASFFDYDTGIYVPGRVYDEDFDPDEDDPYLASGNYSQRGAEWERPVHVEIFDPGGSRAVAQDAGVRIHGSTTRGYPQKSIRLYARSEYGKGDFDYAFFGPGELDEIDTLLLRNGGQGFYSWRFIDLLFHELVKGAPVDTQAYGQSVVFLDGVYWGMHTFRERFDADYVERHYGVDSSDVVMLTRNGELDHGEPEDTQHWDDMIAFMKANDLSDDANFDWVAEQLDVDSLLHFIAIHLVSGSSDWVPSTRNHLYWRKRTAAYLPGAPPGHDGRWRWMLKDIDRGLVNGVYRNNFVANLANWTPYTSLIANTGFRNDLVNLLSDYMNGRLHTDRMIAEIDRLVAEADPYLDEHIARWQWPTSRSYWEAQIEAGRGAARDRPSILRTQMLSEFGLPGTFTLTLDLSNADRGSVRVSTLDLAGASGVWNGIYFEDLPVPLVAEPDVGVHFLGWGDDGDSADPQFDLLASDDVLLVPRFGFAARWTLRELYSAANPAVQYIELTTLHDRNPIHAGAVLECGNGIDVALPMDLPSDATKGRSVLIATAAAAGLEGMPPPDFLLPDGCLDPAGGTITLDGIEIANYDGLPTNGFAVDAAGNLVVPRPANFAGGIRMLPALGGFGLLVVAGWTALLGALLLRRCRVA